MLQLNSEFVCSFFYCIRSKFMRIMRKFSKLVIWTPISPISIEMYQMWLKYLAVRVSRKHWYWYPSLTFQIRLSALCYEEFIPCWMRVFFHALPSMYLCSSPLSSLNSRLFKKSLVKLNWHIIFLHHILSTVRLWVTASFQKKLPAPFCVPNILPRAKAARMFWSNYYAKYPVMYLPRDWK